MENNIDLKNLSKYKYVYKIYFVNKVVCTERFPIVYISKNACYYSDGSGYLTKIDSSKFRTEKDIQCMCAEIITNNYYPYSDCKFYIISKKKIDEKIKKIVKLAKREIVIKQIEILTNTLNKLGEEE